MNCKDFLKEFEERKPLTEAASAHVGNCKDCKKTNEEQTRVWKMIETFEAVDAPKDFDFRVKARIANAKLSDYERRFLPALRYVFPLSAAILIFAVLFFNGIRFGGVESVPQTAENFSQPKLIEMTNEKANSFTAQTETPDESKSTGVEKTIPNVLTPVETAREAKVSQNKARFIAAKSTRKIENREIKKDARPTDFGGSRDSASTSSKVIVPRETVEIAPKSPENNFLSAEEVLFKFGVETVLQNGAWQVKSVKANSNAARSGVKADDKIEAIDGKKLTVETTRGKSFEGKKVTVTTKTETKDISLNQ